MLHEEIEEVLRDAQLRWYGCAQRREKDDYLRKVATLSVPRERQRRQKMKEGRCTEGHGVDAAEGGRRKTGASDDFSYTPL